MRLSCFRLVVHGAAQIVAYFSYEDDALETYKTTYAKVEDKPRFVIEPVEFEIHSIPTHL